MTAPNLFVVGNVVRLAPDPNYPNAVYSDTEWEIIGVYRNAFGLWAVGQVTKGTSVGDQAPLTASSDRYELVPNPGGTKK